MKTHQTSITAQMNKRHLSKHFLNNSLLLIVQIRCHRKNTGQSKSQRCFGHLVVTNVQIRPMKPGNLCLGKDNHLIRHDASTTFPLVEKFNFNTVLLTFVATT